MHSIHWNILMIYLMEDRIMLLRLFIWLMQNGLQATLSEVRTWSPSFVGITCTVLPLRYHCAIVVLQCSSSTNLRAGWRDIFICATLGGITAHGSAKDQWPQSAHLWIRLYAFITVTVTKRCVAIWMLIWCKSIQITTRCTQTVHVMIRCTVQG